MESAESVSPKIKLFTFLKLKIIVISRLRAVSYFSLQSYCTRNLRTRAAKPRAARNEGLPRGMIRDRLFSSGLNPGLTVIITSWFAIALDEIRTRRILREKVDCKQSNSYPTRIFCRVCRKPGIRKKQNKTKQNINKTNARRRMPIE